MTLLANLEEGVFERVERVESNPKRFSGSSSSARASFDSRRSSDMPAFGRGIQAHFPRAIAEMADMENLKENGKAKTPLRSRIRSVGKRTRV